MQEVGNRANWVHRRIAMNTRQ